MSNVLGLGRVPYTTQREELLQKYFVVDNPEYLKLKSLGKYVGSTPKTNSYYYSDKEFLYFPKYFYGNKDLNDNSDEVVVSGLNANIKFDLKLRDYQRDFFSDNKILIDDYESYVMNLKTGNGKTICGLYAMQHYKKKTLIVAETKYLINQWINRIIEFNPTRTKYIYNRYSYNSNSIYNNILIINNNTKKELIKKYDILIITMKGYSSLNSELKSELQKTVGVTIVDEGHRVGASTFYPLLEEMPSKYKILLTATYRRKDGMVDVMDYHFEKVFSLENKLPKAKLFYLNTGIQSNIIVKKSKLEYIEAIKETIESKQFVYETREVLAYRSKIAQNGIKINGKLNKTVTNNLKVQERNLQSTDVIKFLSQCPKRRRMLYTLVRACVSSGRRVIIPSPLLDFMYEIKSHLDKFCNVFILDGETNAKLDPQELQDKIKNADVILGSNKVVQEGMDIDWLDTLILYFPNSDIEQVVGRITRIVEGKNTPKVIYFKDYNRQVLNSIKKSQEHKDNYDIIGTFELEELRKMI